MGSSSLFSGWTRATRRMGSSIQRVDEDYSEDWLLYTAGGRGLLGGWAALYSGWTRAILMSSKWHRKPAEWHPMAIRRTARSTAAHRANFLCAPQHHSSFASSSDHALLTMPPRRRRERD